MQKKTFTRQDFVNWGKQGLKKVIKKHGKKPTDIRWDRIKKLSTAQPENTPKQIV